MTMTQLRELLERHGAVSDRWPAALRRQAERLIADDPHAAAANRQAARLDALIADNDPVAVIDDQRVARLMAAVQASKGVQNRAMAAHAPAGWRAMVDLLSEMLDTRPALLLPRFVAPLLVAALLGLWVGQTDHTVRSDSALSQVSSLFEQSHWVSADL